jgi:hypothetical protein
MFVSGALSAVGYPKASSPALACYECVQGTAGGVGGSSSVDRLTDVPEFRQVRHRRKSFARVPRRWAFSEVPPSGLPLCLSIEDRGTIRLMILIPH